MPADERGWDPKEGPFHDSVLAVNFVADAGKQLLESSTSVSEALDRLHRFLPAVGLEGCAMDATTSKLILSYWHPDQPMPLTAMRELDIGEPRLERLTGTDALLDDVERHALDLPEAAARLEQLETAPAPRQLRTRLAALGSVVGWVLYLGGADLVTVLVALLATVLTFPAATFARRFRVPSLAAVFLAAVIAAAVPNLAAAAGVAIRVGPAVVGAIYLYLPGRAFVSAVIDGLGDAPLSAIARGLQSILTAGFLAVGMLLGTRIGVSLGLGQTPDAPPAPEIVSVLGAGIGVAGIAVSWSMPRAQVLPSALIGVVGWIIVTIAPASDSLNWPAYGIAAGIVGVTGALVSPFQTTPASIYTGVAILPLVPGFTLYLGMAALAQGDSSAAATAFAHAGVLSLSIAAGVAVGLSIGRNTAAIGHRLRPSR